MKISAIVTAHDEGLTAHKTLLSVVEAIKQLPSEIKTELIVHLDNGDETTRNYLSHCQAILDLPKSTTFHVYENCFGDLGESRNFTVQQATGDYIFFLDADDLTSKDTLKMALEAAKADGDRLCLYHQEYLLAFDYEHYFARYEDALSKDQAAYGLCSQNLWGSSVFGKRSIFLSHPYMRTEHGYGHEDYAFNTATISDDILHKVIKGTIRFYRRKQLSLSQINNQNAVLQPYSSLFDFEYFKTIPIPNTSENQQKLTTKEHLLQSYRNLRYHKIPNLLIEPFADLGKKITGKKLIKETVPPYLQKDFLDKWLEISNIETQLFPTKSFVNTLTTYKGESCLPSKEYHRLAQSVKALPDYVFIVPWVVTGGADKVLFSYIKAITELKPSANITVISTLPSKNEWAHRLPDNVSFLDFGLSTKKINNHLRHLDELFGRILIQLQCRRIHIINSTYAYGWLYRHLDFVRNNDFYITASVFARMITPKSQNLPCVKVQGYSDFADPVMVEISSVLKGIYTDNTNTVRRLAGKNGFPSEIVKVHFQPVAMSDNIATKASTVDLKSSNHASVKHILWASRICSAKNPELLVKIAKNLNGDKYHIDAYGKPDEGFKASILNNLPTLSYHGAFSNINDIHPEKYDALLYTSIIDGIPNIILEVASRKVPIIASNAGGIGDVIHDHETGLLIDDLEDPTPYLAAIDELFSDETQSQKYAQNAYELIKTQHSKEQFLKCIENDFLA